MGLDVYVGSFTRYYTHDWETIIQQAGRAQGFPVQIIRTNPEPDDAIEDSEQLREVAVAWRAELTAKLREARLVDTDLDWEERADAPYFTDKPNWDCYGALQLLAAFEERPRLRLGRRWPKRMSRDWMRDLRLLDRLRTSTAPRYAHVYGCEIWLPVELNRPFQGRRPTGEITWIGSSVQLLGQLWELNERTFGGSSDELDRWGRDSPDGSDPRFEPRAKAGLSIMLRLTAASVNNRLPMLLDY